VHCIRSASLSSLGLYKTILYSEFRKSQLFQYFALSFFSKLFFALFSCCYFGDSQNLGGPIYRTARLEPLGYRPIAEPFFEEVGLLWQGDTLIQANWWDFENRRNFCRLFMTNSVRYFLRRVNFQ